MPTFQLLQGQDEGTGSQRWRDGMDSRDKHSHTLWKKTCPRVLQALAGCIGTETFLGAFGRGAGGGCEQKDIYLCPEAVMYATCLGHFIKHK